MGLFIRDGKMVMPRHKIYGCMVKAVKDGRLKEPFTRDDFMEVCPDFAERTYKVFLNKHRIGNPGGNSELFERVSKGSFKIVRPFKYGFGQA